MEAAHPIKAQIPDIAGQITYAMRTMGIAPIPRNYELFYEAYLGSNQALTKELAALGKKASQEELDQIGKKYFNHHQHTVVDDAHGRLISELDGVLRLLKQEQTSLESYNRLLGETYNRINTKSTTSAELLRNAISILADATGETIANGAIAAENMNQKSLEMESVRQELDEYKRIANTDSLTRLSNRRAFDDKLATVFDNAMSASITALVIVDIDHFKKVNDTYGHPVGDKILATVATVIRANLRKDVFVARTGGEEFAFILEGNTLEEVIQICERVRRSLEATPFKNSKTGINYGPITISVGICMAAEAQDPGDLYSKSDVALYCAKNSGRNRTVAFEDGMRKEFQKGWLIYKK